MRLNQVTLGCRQLARAVAFYRRLELELLVLAPHYARLMCPGNAATLSLEVDEAMTSGSTVVYFECDDLDARYERLRGVGVQFDTAPTDEPWLWREARLRDPDGNQLCFYFAGSNRLDPPWRVGAESA